MCKCGCFWTVVLSTSLAIALSANAQTPQPKSADTKAPPAAKGTETKASEKKIEVGQTAPQFALTDVNGMEQKLADFKGKIVVLEWVNHQCPFCQRHVKGKTADNVLAAFPGKPVVWIGIDSTGTCEENKEKIKHWTQSEGINYSVLLDASGAVGKQYGAKTTPHVFVIDQKGILAYAGAIDDDPSGNKEKKRNFVEDAIRALLEGSTVATKTTDPYGCSVKYKS